MKKYISLILIFSILLVPLFPAHTVRAQTTQTPNATLITLISAFDTPSSSNSSCQAPLVSHSTEVVNQTATIAVFPVNEFLTGFKIKIGPILYNVSLAQGINANRAIEIPSFTYSLDSIPVGTLVQVQGNCGAIASSVRTALSPISGATGSPTAVPIGLSNPLANIQLQGILTPSANICGTTQSGFINAIFRQGNQLASIGFMTGNGGFGVIPDNVNYIALGSKLFVSKASIGQGIFFGNVDIIINPYTPNAIIASPKLLIGCQNSLTGGPPSNIAVVTQSNTPALPAPASFIYPVATPNPAPSTPAPSQNVAITITPVSLTGLVTALTNLLARIIALTTSLQVSFPNATDVTQLQNGPLYAVALSQLVEKAQQLIATANTVIATNPQGSTAGTLPIIYANLVSLISYMTETLTNLAVVHQYVSYNAYRNYVYGHLGYNANIANLQALDAAVNAVIVAFAQVLASLSFSTPLP